MGTLNRKLKERESDAKMVWVGSLYTSYEGERERESC